MPSDSVGMTVRARASNGYDYVEEEIGVVTDINTTLKKTVSLYSFADKLEINFYKGDSIKYYVPVSNKHKNSQTGEYDISGYYYYYAAASGQLNAVIDVSKIQTLEYDKKYRFSTNDVPYLIWKATGVKEMLQASVAFAKENGYEPYYLYRQKNMAENLENVGYARNGKEGLYNILIMEEKHTILALGAGASTKFVFPDGKRIERVENVKSLLDYINRIDEMIERKKTFLKSVEGLF